MVIELHEAYIYTGMKYIRIEFKFNKKSRDFFSLHSGKTQYTISAQTIWEQNFSLHWTCRVVQICKQEINGSNQFNDKIPCHTHLLKIKIETLTCGLSKYMF